MANNDCLATVNLAPYQKKIIDKWMEEGFIKSRSDFVRQCITLALPHFTGISLIMKRGTPQGLYEVFDKAGELIRKEIDRKNFEINASFEKVKTTNGKHPKSLEEYAKNIYWQEIRVKNGVIKLPVEPEGDNGKLQERINKLIQ